MYGFITRSTQPSFARRIGQALSVDSPWANIGRICDNNVECGRCTFWRVVDDGIARAIQIGESNARVIELAQNWCAHLEVEKNGGTGLVEIQTGLPIGMRSFKCVHASAAGFAGMALEGIALDFYDRNCVGCDKRSPVRLPNLSQLVAERDDAKKSDEARHEVSVREERTRYEARNRARLSFSQNADEATRALIENIDALDREPTTQKVEVLIQLAAVAPERFDAGVKQALFQLAQESSSYLVLDAVLKTLKAIHADSKALCSAALRVLSHSHLSIAGTIVAESVTSEHVEDVPVAIPALISLAGPHDNWFPLPELRDEPEGLLAAYKVAPTAVSDVIRDMLRSAQKIVRIGAIHAIQRIRETDDRFGMALVEALVFSLELPDDHYDRGSAETWAQDVLAEMLEEHFNEVDPILTASFPKLGEHDDDVGLMHVYLRLFRSYRHGRDRTIVVTHVHEELFGRLLRYLSTTCAEQGSIQLLEFLRSDAKEFPALVESHIDGLLGAVAILADEQVAASTFFSQLHLPPDPLAALEAESRKNSLHHLVEAVAQLIGTTAKERPTTVGATLLATLTKIEAGHDELRSALVKAVGRMAQNRDTLPAILPSLYNAMMGTSQKVRSAAAEAYGELIQRDPDDLPPLLHETFVTLLTDPYLIVHSAALDVVDRHRLPEVYNNTLSINAYQIVEMHSGEKRNKGILKVALDVLLDLQRGRTSGITPALRDWIIQKLTLCRSFDRAELLRRHASQLMSGKGFTKSILDLLAHRETTDHTIADLLKVLYRVPPDEIRSMADEFVAAMMASSGNGNHVVDAAIEILTGASLWGHATKLAKSEETRWRDTEWDRQRRLHSKLRTLNCEIEQNSSRSDLSALRESIAAFRRVQKEISEDALKHKKRRQPLFGINIEGESA